MTDYQKLEAIYNEIDTLIEKRVMAESPEFESWHSRAERFLVNHFGPTTYEVTDFSNTLFSPTMYVPGADYIRISTCSNGLKKTKDVFKDYLTEIKKCQKKTRNCRKMYIRIRAIKIIKYLLFMGMMKHLKKKWQGSLKNKGLKQLS